MSRGQLSSSTANFAALLKPNLSAEVMTYSFACGRQQLSRYKARSGNPFRAMRMKFTEAFEALGYELADFRQDWTAEKSDGVCISLWKKEMGTRHGLLWMNTRVHADPIDQWRDKAGNRRRIASSPRARPV